jgi:hypothetical protein
MTSGTDPSRPGGVPRQPSGEPEAGAPQPRQPGVGGAHEPRVPEAGTKPGASAAFPRRGVARPDGSDGSKPGGGERAGGEAWGAASGRRPGSLDPILPPELSRVDVSAAAILGKTAGAAEANPGDGGKPGHTGKPGDASTPGDAGKLGNGGKLGDSKPGDGGRRTGSKSAEIVRVERQPTVEAPRGGGTRWRWVAVAGIAGAVVAVGVQILVVPALTRDEAEVSTEVPAGEGAAQLPGAAVVPDGGLSSSPQASVSASAKPSASHSAGAAPSLKPSAAKPSAKASTATATAAAGRPNTAGADLALNRTVWASGSEGAPWKPENAVDGDPETRWGSAFSDGQWIAVDLGAVWQVKRAEIDWENAFATVYNVQVSTDKSSWKTVYSTNGNLGGKNVVELKPVAARYVRVVGVKRSNQYGISMYRFTVK